MGVLKIPEPDLPPDELEAYYKLGERFHQKLEEYKQKFNDEFTTELLPMTKEEIIENIDKCIKNNRKWDGYIVPELDYDDVDI